MAPLRSLGNIFSAFDDFYARTGTDAVSAAPSGGGALSATGGATATPGDGYTYHFITAPGQNFVVSSGSAEVEYIAIGGGGGGGDRGNGAGGGGAGGLLTTWPGPEWTGGTSRNRGPTLNVTAQTYTITIGTGGRGGTEQSPEGTPPSNGGVGGDTTIAGPDITTITVKGGGNGYSPGGDGGGGGSGGGANGPGTGGAGQNYPGTTQQGFPGGGVTPDYYGGGGGGSSQAGNAGGPGVQANGGNGDGFDGIPSSYGTGDGPDAGKRYFCGGGGGGGNSSNPAPGGYGGGGSGAKQSSNNTSSSGTDGTGGGGGGGADGSNNGGNNSEGGDGIVIIRYQ